ncbi:MAG: hypothetical protein IT366_08455 [Candidatus Hydrogenedentes bacterium]|nr:hypothetical protein [Candidatus Hydrogenedentota bacterium]
MNPITLIVTSFAPAVITGICVLLFSVRKAMPESARAAAAIATGIGAISGIALVIGENAFHPSQSTDWLAICGAVLAMYGGVESFAIKQGAARITSRLLLIAALTLFLLYAPIRNTWPWHTSAAWVLGATAITLVLWQFHDASIRRENNAIVAMILLLSLTGASMLMVLGGSAKLGQLAGAVVSAFGAMAVLTWWNPNRFSLAGAIALAWPLSALVWVLAHTYAEASLLPTALMLGATATPALSSMKRIQARKPWQRLVLYTITSAALLALAIFIAYRNYAASSEYTY